MQTNPSTSWQQRLILSPRVATGNQGSNSQVQRSWGNLSLDYVRSWKYGLALGRPLNWWSWVWVENQRLRYLSSKNNTCETDGKIFEVVNSRTENLQNNKVLIVNKRGWKGVEWIEFYNIESTTWVFKSKRGSLDLNKTLLISQFRAVLC